MNDKQQVTEGNFSSKDITSIPVIVTTLMVLYFGISFAVNGGIGNDGLAKIFILPLAAALAAAVGRISPFLPMENFSKYRSISISFGIILVAFLLNIISPSNFNNIFILTFIFVGLSSVALSQLKRFEASNILLSIVVGFHLAVSFASNIFTDAGLDVNSERSAIGIAFMTFWIASISVGFTLAMYLRGTLDHKGDGPIFSEIPTFNENKSIVLFSTFISIIYLIPLLQIENNQSLGIGWAIFTNLIIIFYAFCYSERWNVIGALIAINWFIYTLGHLQEIGNTFYPNIFEGEDFLGAFSWFFITFWLNVLAITLASRGYFGDIAPMRTHGKFRLWWNSNFYNILIPLSLITALAVRIIWNVIPAMNASGTGDWDMSGGSDPWYMKRVVDYIVANNSHLIFDMDRAYPIGAINPRPPLFTWSLALGGIALSWILESDNTGEVVWWSLAAMPAIYGALVVLPVSGTANKIYGKKAAIISAWLIALMPGHISRSTFGMVDHDSFAILLLSTAFYFWIASLSHMSQERFFAKTSANPLYLLAGIRESWNRNPKVMANATLSGISFAVMALGWKGFVYGPSIIFLVFSLQLLFNLFRSRDSIQLCSANFQMLFTTFIISLPFYAWPGLNLVTDPNGLQPLFFVIGFSIILGWVTCSFRDKPWLLVLGVGTALVSFILGILFILQEINAYAGWDILFTGGFYFDKNKIFGTIGEAQAPSRGVLFASYGPIVALIALSFAFVFLWKGARNNQGAYTLLGSWGIISTYMAWSAGRFIINATPIMAILGGIGIAMLWKSANFSQFTKEWRNSGIGTPRARFRSLWPATKSHVGVPVMAIIFMLVFSQHVTYGIDSGIPRQSEYASDVDQTIYDLTPDILKTKLIGKFSILDSSDYDPSRTEGMQYIGTFGPSFNSYGWNDAYSWLEQQDSEISFSERPAFVSWWDYGFSALAHGQHPTVADNFQSGIPHSGGMLLSQGQEDTIALFLTTLTQGDMKYNGGLSEELLNSLSSTMNEAQLGEFIKIMTNSKSSFVIEHAMQVRAASNGVELLSGFPLNSNGIPSMEIEWIVVSENGDTTSLGGNQSAAVSLYNQTRGSASVSSTLSDWDEGLPPSYYDIGGYRYTTDLIDDFESASTGIHRTNSKLAISRAFFTTSFDIEQLVDMYHGISSSITYSVQDYEGALGETVDRNNEIRYFAVDNRLYPLGGSYYNDYSYHYGQTTGIFHAPTGLSGLDMDDYISTLYQTQRGDGAITPLTADQFNDAYMRDLELQQSGAISDASQVIRYTDIDYQHTANFFETMVARTYVGYGTSTLGLQGDAETPSVWFNPQTTGLTGAPGSYLQNAWALPGAMMNHMVISNWYDSDYDDDGLDNLVDDMKCDELIESPTIQNLSIGDTSILLLDGSLMPLSGSAFIYHPAGNISVKWTDKNGNTLTGVTGVTKEIVSDSLLSHNPSALCGSIYDSNRFVKILKYYSGATLEGTVSLDSSGIVPNARILVERDAFSGDEIENLDGSVIDRDDRTYWIPIGYTDSNEDGEFSLTVPAGKIRVSAYIGDIDLDSARASIMTSDVGSTMFELTIEENSQRMTNPITGILGNVAGATWLAESIVNISGTDGHSNGEEILQVNIDVDSSSASGVLTWSGSGDFNGEPIKDAQIVLSPSSESVILAPYLLDTSNGTVEGSKLQFQGLGNVTFTGEGSVQSDSILSVSNFTGNHTQTVYNNHSIIGDGLFVGQGHLSNGIINDDITYEDCQDSILPNGNILCHIGGDEYLLNGSINASGRFTSDGISTFTKFLNQATLIGSGIFTVDTSQSLDSYGIIDGTGSFLGTGIFSGPMVQPGTFQVDDAIPGTYDISVIFEDGSHVNLSTQFIIPLMNSPMPTPISVFGGSISGNLIDSAGAKVNSSISLIHSEDHNNGEITTRDCIIVNVAPCLIYPDDSGKITFGPVIPGSYVAEIDSDNDGMPEISVVYEFSSDASFDAIFPSPIPETSDLRFKLLNNNVSIENLNVSFYSENDESNIVNALFDADLSEYIIELTPGTWILSHNLDENNQIWKIIEIGSVDLVAEYNFEVSKIISGNSYLSTMSLNNEPIISVLPNQPIKLYWGDGLSTIVNSDSSGYFEVSLPVNSIVDASLIYTLDTAYSTNIRFTVNTDIDDNQSFNLTANKAIIVDGTLSMDILGNYYTNSLNDWEIITVIARQTPMDESQPYWRTTVDQDGNFRMFIKEGNWQFSIESNLNASIDEELNSYYINESSKNVDLLINSEMSFVTIVLFIDHSQDGNITNGTLVNYPFAIKSTNPLIPTYEFSLSSDEWISTGTAEISLSPGVYSIAIDRPNPSSGDKFDTLYNSNDIIEIGLISQSISIPIAFEPNWLTNITIKNESGGLLANELVKLKDVESGWLLSYMTNSNGSISTYIPEGEWLVTVDPTETNSGVFESIRELLNVSNTTASQESILITSEVAFTTITLTDGVMPLSNAQLKLTNDILGSFNSPYSDDLGRIELKIEPGMWDVELNYTDANDVMWIINSTSLSDSELTPGINQDIDLNVSKYVNLKGTVFWDLNDNDSPNIGEGMFNTSIILMSDDQNIYLKTDESGQWSTYLPYGSNWTISSELDGFDNEEVNVTLVDDSNVKNIEISAGIVEITGQISYIDVDQFQDISDNVEIIIMPKSGIIRDRVIPNKILDDQMLWNGEWSAMVEPGDWIVWITAESSSNNVPYLVSMNYIDVGIGINNVQSDLSIGGKLILDTKWLDYNGTSNDLLDLQSHNIVFSISGSKLSWDEQLGNDGLLELILPAGQIDTYSSFNFSQQNRLMDYSGGKGATIRTSQTTPLITLEITAIKNQEISISNSGLGYADLSFTDSNCLVNCTYNPVEFNFNIEYLGHQSYDNYTINGVVPGADGSLWDVEFKDSFGNWTNTKSIDMGLENSMMSILQARIIPANVDEAHHLMNGHQIKIIFSTMDGYVKEHVIIVNVPQNHQFNSDGFLDSVYGVVENELLSIDIEFSNLGNGDDIFRFDYSIESIDDWTISGIQSQPSSPFSNGSTSVSILPPTNLTDDVFTLQLLVTGENNDTYGPYTTTIMKSSPILSISDDNSIMLLSGDTGPLAGEIATYLVVVKNSGLIDASSVELNGVLCSDIGCNNFLDVNGSDISNVAAKGSSTFYINMDFTNIEVEKYFVEFYFSDIPRVDRVDKTSCSDLKIDSTECVKEAQVLTPDEDSDNPLLGYIIGLLLLITLLYIISKATRKPGAPF